MRALKNKSILVVIVILALLSSSSVMAQGGAPACTGDSVSGTVVAVDKTNMTVTIDTGAGQCMVTINGGSGHPVGDLLGAYFGDVNLDGLLAALDTIHGCALEDGGAWTWVSCETAGSVPVTVTGDNGGGSFTAKTEGGEAITLTADETAAAALSGAVRILTVSWKLNEDGSVHDAGEDIMDYHDSGIGFGVLTKLYAIAAESQEACAEQGITDESCGVTVAELIAMLESGMSMGDLFELFGKPAMTGVGHVRQAAGGGDDGGGGDDDGDGTGKGNNGICNARGNGGKAHAHGQGEIDCPDD